MEKNNNIIYDISSILKERKKCNSDKSYTANLYRQGLDVILKKIGEESAEVLIAAKNKSDDSLIYEIADLWFHSLVLLEYKDIEYKKIEDELERRFGQSGLLEKSKRLNKGG